MGEVHKKGLDAELVWNNLENLKIRNWYNRQIHQNGCE